MISVSIHSLFYSILHTSLKRAIKMPALATAFQTFACMYSMVLWVAYELLMTLALLTSSASSLNTPYPVLPIQQLLVVSQCPQASMLLPSILQVGPSLLLNHTGNSYLYFKIPLGHHFPRKSFLVFPTSSPPISTT